MEAAMAASVVVASAFAAEPARPKVTSMEWFLRSLGEAPTVQPSPEWTGFTRPAWYQGVAAGATVRDRSGWSASLFVAYVDRLDFVDEPSVRLASTPVVNATLARRLTRSSRVSFDVFNVFDRKAPGVDYLTASQAWDPAGIADTFLFHPAEPRGFRIRFRATF
jgi:outer membrane receptor protein involved in Fe transport